MSYEALALLREIRDRLDALPAAIAAAVDRERPRRPPSRTDAALFAVLLPAIHRGLPNVTFSVALLGEYAELNAPEYETLGAALTSVGSPLKIGRLLLRGSQSSLDGYLIEKVGESAEGALWSVAEVVNIVTKTHKTPSGRLSGEVLKP